MTKISKHIKMYNIAASLITGDIFLKILKESILYEILKN